MQLSVVTTMYRSAPFLGDFHRRLSATASRLTEDWELILVDDGSPDESLALALEIQRGDPRVRVVELSRNFGHHPAMLTGLRSAGGERVFLVDCDLEEPPELLEQFWRTMDESPDVDVVYGVQHRRAGSRLERFAGALFDRLFNAIAEVEVARNGLHVRLMTSRYVRALATIDERDLFLVGVFDYLGFRQRAITIERQDRAGSSYTFGRRLALFNAAVTSFSVVPLRMSLFLGLGIATISLLFSFWIVLRVMLGEDLLLGWPSLMASIWFLGGVILVAVGVMGAYVGRIYREVKGRPGAIVREVHESPRPAPTRHVRSLTLPADPDAVAEIVRREGCVVLRRFEDGATVELLRAEAAGLLAEDAARSDAESSGLVYAVMTRSRLLLDYMTQPTARAVFRRLLGDGCVVHHYCVSAMPPGKGNRGSETHTDVPRSRLIPGYPTNVGLLLALDRFTPENGAFEIAPASFVAEEALDEETFARERVVVELDAGDAVVFNARCAHRGGINRTDQWRHALSLHACRPYMRQLFDYPRMMAPAMLAELDPDAQQFLGCWVRMPTSLEEWNLPPTVRPYRPGQE